ncbi:arylamine N-acetyltransferase family protein [Phaeobacter marinintestinus]|uniref:arylamine N-acetyltransferase family protein n=1 Tax=Falsiphaeobacter marinintestinus TaxID=1492905 RepID=UPI0011B80FF7|nr:arylamine N-acetyltransferase [Phaeobacter marinintestinus]
MTPFDLNAYLARIGLTDVPCTADGLRALQVAQLRAIPFESVDPYLGLIPDLTPQAIFDKTVHDRRGGYCFELNTLFGAALQALGFETIQRLGRVRRVSPLGGPRSHLVQQVTIDGVRWLADTGFGGPGSLVPLQINHDAPQETPTGLYRLRWDDLTGEHVLEKQSQDAWTALYAFDEAFVGPWDIAGANHLCAVWDQMPFPNNLMLAGFDGDTRIGVFGRDVTIQTAGQEDRRKIADKSDLIALIKRLGLTFDPATVDRVWTKLSTA